MARRPESQVTTPVEIARGSHLPQDFNQDEPFLRPTDDGLDSPISNLGGIELPESDPVASDRGGFLPVEPVCVSTGIPSESLRRVSLPPTVSPLVSDHTAELSPVLLDIQLPDVKSPRAAGAHNARPDPHKTNRGALNDPVISSDGAGTSTEVGRSVAAHSGQSLRGFVLLIAMIVAAGSLIAVLIFLLNTPSAPPEVGQSNTWLSPVEPERHSKPNTATPPVVEPVRPDEPKVAQVVVPAQKTSETSVQKPAPRKNPRPSSPPKSQPLVRSVQEDRKTQIEEPEPPIPAQEPVPATPRPSRARPDMGSQPIAARSKKVTRARPTRSITFPESALRLLHNQRDAEIIVTVAVNRFGFPKATEVRSKAPLPDLVIGLFERAIDDVNWIPAKSESGESIADVVSVRFRAAEGDS